MTAIAGGVVSAADFNQFIRDNLNVSEGALSLTPSGYMAVTGAHTIAERVPANDFITTQETTTSTTYTNLATVGPTCTVTTGTQALVIVGGRIGPNTGAASSVKMSWACSGATTIDPNSPANEGDKWGVGEVGLGTTGVLIGSRPYFMTGLNAGSNTFQAKYAVSSGTGTFDNRSITVLPL